MQHTTMVIEGVAGRAARLGPHDLTRGFIDQWVIDLREPRMFWAGGQSSLHSRLSLITASVGSFGLPGGPRPGSTHGTILVVTEQQAAIQSTGAAGARLPLAPFPIGVYQGTLRNDNACTMVGHVLAKCLAHGEVVVGTRNAGCMFEAAAAAVFTCAGLVSVLRPTAHAMQDGGGHGPDETA